MTSATIRLGEIASVADLVLKRGRAAPFDGPRQGVSDEEILYGSGWADDRGEDGDAEALRPTDILITGGVAHERAVVTLDDPAGRRITSGRYFRVRPDGRMVDPRYLLWTLRHRLPELGAGARGGGRPRIGRELLLGLELALPERPFQQSMSELLDRAERLKELRDQAEEVRSRLTPATFRQHFGQFDADWPRRQLGELIRVAPASEKDVPPQVTQLAGDRVIAIGRSGASCGAVELRRGPQVAEGDQLLVSRISRDLEPRFLVEALRRAQLRRHALGTITPRLTIPVVYAVEIMVPPLALQRRFSTAARRQDELAERAAGASRSVDRLAHSLRMRVFGHAPAVLGESGELHLNRGGSPDAHHRVRQAAGDDA